MKMKIQNQAKKNLIKSVLNNNNNQRRFMKKIAMRSMKVYKINRINIQIKDIFKHSNNIKNSWSQH